MAFHATSYTVIHLLHPQMRELTKQMLQYSILVDRIDIADVTKTQFEDINNQLNDEYLEIGVLAWSSVDTVTEDGTVPEVT